MRKDPPFILAAQIKGPKRLTSVKRLCAASMFMGCFIATVSPGAIVTVAYRSADDESFTLSDLGTSDWAYWDTADNPAAGTPTNEQSGGSIIGSLSAVGGGSLRGSASSVSPTNDFSFSDGSSPVNSSISDPSGLFNTFLDSAGVGLSLTFTLPTTDTYEIRIWTAMLKSNGTLSTSLSGATDTDTIGAATNVGDTSKGAGLFTITATADNPGDVLTTTFVLSDDLGDLAHILINGAAVSVIPEPVFFANSLIVVAAFFVFLRRRRES